MPKVTKVEFVPKLKKNDRVAAYTRVSCDKDSMLHSLSAQVSYYSDLIQSNSEWEYAGVYTDEALSGTRDNRADFQRMVRIVRPVRLTGLLQSQFLDLLETQ